MEKFFQKVRIGVRWFRLYFVPRMINKITGMKSITPKGEALLEYIMKIIHSHGEYQPTTYQEQMLEEAVDRAIVGEELTRLEKASQLFIILYPYH